MKELVSLRQAASLIGVNYKTVLKWRDKGRITYHEPKQGGIELSEVLRIKKERGEHE